MPLSNLVKSTAPKDRPSGIIPIGVRGGGTNGLRWDHRRGPSGVIVT